ncbi:MAG: beta-1,6-N-acetylglucosaminyltransferase [Brevinema sp.]
MLIKVNYELEKVKIRLVYGIVAYEKPSIVIRQIEDLYTNEDFFIVHWNQKSSTSELKELKKHFADKTNVRIISKHKVYWGDISILNAQLSCMKTALKLPFQWDYFISMSNHCFPVKKPKYIKEFYSKYDSCYPGYSFCTNHEDEKLWEYIEFHKYDQIEKNKIIRIIKKFLILFMLINESLFRREISIKRYLKTIKKWLGKIIKQKQEYFYSNNDVPIPNFISKFPVAYNLDLLPKENNQDINTPVGQSGPIGSFSYKHINFLLKELSIIHSTTATLYRYFHMIHAPEESFIYGILKNTPITQDEIVCITLHWTIHNRSKVKNTNVIPPSFFDNPENFNTCFPAPTQNNKIFQSAYEGVLFSRKFNQPNDIDQFKMYRDSK